jgi:disulfide oxidoreductase YuzD
MEISKRQLQENYNRSNLDNIFNEIVKTKPNRITLSGYFPRIAGFRSELFEKLNNALQEIFKSNNTESYAKYLKNIILQEMVLRDMIIQNTPNSYRLSQKGNIHGEDYFTKAKRIYGEGKIESILNIIEKNIIEMEKPQDNMFEVTKGQLEEAKKARTKLRKKKKGDRCTRIAKSKYDVWPSAYSSGAVVRCRQGKIWKGLKEEEDETLDEKWSEKYKKSIDCNNPKGFSQKAHCKGRLKESEFSKFVGSEFGDEEGNLFSVEEVYEFVEANKEKYFKSNFPISKLIHNLEWWDKNYDINNKEHKRRMMNSDTSYPLLVVKEKNNLSVADGLNRLYKAVNIENKKNIDIYFINKEDIMSLNKKSLNEKTDFSKEKKQGLHGWFARQGGKGKSKGWVDCNTCRDGKCKSCGRKEGESRSKYPACRPTPSACKTKGKGDSWGKKSTNEDILNEQSKQDIEKELKLNEIKNTFKRLIK